MMPRPMEGELRESRCIEMTNGSDRVSAGPSPPAGRARETPDAEIGRNFDTPAAARYRIGRRAKRE